MDSNLASIDFEVLVWWGTLLSISAVNIGLWLYSALRAQREPTPDTQARRARRVQLALSAVYVFGCAFRCLFPRVEARRFVMWDHWLSNAAIGRSVATFAEVAFALQWVLLMSTPALANSSPLAVQARRLLLPLIVSAELFSWYATLSTNHLGGVIEESLWAISAALVLFTLLDLAARKGGRMRLWLSAATLGAAGFLVFLVAVDVPMYWHRWREAVAQGHAPLTLSEGWLDANQRRITTQHWGDWKDEVPWMTMYFSLGVWMSVALTRAPKLGVKSEQY